MGPTKNKRIAWCGKTNTCRVQTYSKCGVLFTYIFSFCVLEATECKSLFSLPLPSPTGPSSLHGLHSLHPWASKVKCIQVKGFLFHGLVPGSTVTWVTNRASICCLTDDSDLLWLCLFSNTASFNLKLLNHQSLSTVHLKHHQFITPHK